MDFLSPYIYILSSVAKIGFDQTSYNVTEGETLSVIVSVSGVTLERDVVVTLMTVDGSAKGNIM